MEFLDLFSLPQFPLLFTSNIRVVHLLLLANQSWSRLNLKIPVFVLYITKIFEKYMSCINEQE